MLPAAQLSSLPLPRACSCTGTQQQQPASIRASLSLHNISYKHLFAFTSPSAYLDGVTAGLIGPELLPRTFNILVTTACGRTARAICANVNKHFERPSLLQRHNSSLPRKGEHKQPLLAWMLLLCKLFRRDALRSHAAHPPHHPHKNPLHSVANASTQERSTNTERTSQLADYRNSSHQMKVIFFAFAMRPSGLEHYNPTTAPLPAPTSQSNEEGTRKYKVVPPRIRKNWKSNLKKLKLKITCQTSVVQKTISKKGYSLCYPLREAVVSMM